MSTANERSLWRPPKWRLRWDTEHLNGAQTYKQGPAGTRKLFNKRKSSKTELPLPPARISSQAAPFQSEFQSFFFLFSLFSEFFSHLKNTGRGAKIVGAIHRGSETGATERPPQRESRGFEHRRGEGRRKMFRSWLPLGFKRTRWTPGPGRSRSGTAPVGKDMHGKRVSSIIERNLWCDFSPSLFVLSFGIWDSYLVLAPLTHSPECPPCWACCSSESSRRGRRPPHSASWPSRTQCCWSRTHRCGRLRFCHTNRAQNSQQVEWRKRGKAQFIVILYVHF